MISSDFIRWPISIVLDIFRYQLVTRYNCRDAWKISNCSFITVKVIKIFQKWFQQWPTFSNIIELQFWHIIPYSIENWYGKYSHGANINPISKCNLAFTCASLTLLDIMNRLNHIYCRGMHIWLDYRINNYTIIDKKRFSIGD